MFEDIINLLVENIKNEKIVKYVFSNPTKKSNIKNEETNELKSSYSNKNYNFLAEKISIKLITIKNEKYIQIEIFKENKAYHKNISISNTEELKTIISDYTENFKQILLKLVGEDIILNRKKENNFTKKINKNNLSDAGISHNNIKNYILKDGEKIDFLIELNVMSKEGKVFKESYSKFRQINRYLEFIDDTIEEMKNKNLVNNKINVLDFGCGKSYLTFALYYYLKNFRKDLNFSIVGLDLKKDVIEFCNKTAEKLSYKNLKFLNGNIKDYSQDLGIDLVFSLHACNNATDYSLQKALELNAKAILAVPCCHHEFYEKISKNKTSPFFSILNNMATNGIMLEKFSTLATDSFRSLALERCGYKVKSLEFIDMEHTPKNILIKAIKTKYTNKQIQEKIEEYNKLKEFLGIEPLLENLLKKYYKVF